MILSVIITLCAIIWLPILFYCIVERSLPVLLMWLLIAPVALNAIQNPNRNPFFTPERRLDYFQKIRFENYQRDLRRNQKSHRLNQPSSIRLKEVLDPTRLLIFTFALVLLLERVYRHRQPIPLDSTEIWMILFAGLLAVNVVLMSDRLPNSLRVTTDAFVVPFLAYAVTRRLVSNQERLQQFTWIMTVLGLYIIGIAMVERAMHSNLLYRIKGPFTARNHFAVVMMIVFFTALIDQIRLCDRAKIDRGLRRIGRGLVLLLAPVAIFATWTRSNWLGFLAGILVLLFLARPYFTRAQKIAYSGAMLLILPLSLIGFQLLIPDEIMTNRISNFNTIYARIGAWILQLQEGIKNPIFGIGFNNVRTLLETQRIYFMGIASETYSHNCFLAFFVELGVFGLFFYLAMSVSIIRTGWRYYREGRRLQDRWLGICVIAIFVAYLTPAITSTILYVPALSHVYVFACIGALIGSTNRARSAAPFASPALKINPIQTAS